MKKTVMCAALAMAFSAGAAQAVIIQYQPTTTGNNFTMVSASNGLTGGTNDVTFTWDGTLKNAVVTNGSSNASLSSPTAFSGKKWTAHHMNVYGTGTYTFNTGCPAANTTDVNYNPSCGTGPSYTMTVGAGQVGAHMLFNWSTSTNIDVVVLWSMNNSWAGSGTVSAFNTGGTNTVNTVWNGVSIDTSMDTDTFSGTQMIDGPFVGQSANFNVMGISAISPVYTVTAAVNITLGSVISGSTAAATAGAVPPANVNFNSGFVKYKLDTLVPNIIGSGQNGATVTIVFPEAIAGKDIYHFKESTGTYTKLTAGVLVNQYQLVNATTITISVTDGGPLDDGPAADGFIIDPIGLGTPTVTADEVTLGVSGGGGGCVFNPNGQFDASLILTLLASLGYLGWKRKRRN